jgi:hypothetical protein
LPDRHTLPKRSAGQLGQQIVNVLKIMINPWRAKTPS